MDLLNLRGDRSFLRYTPFSPSYCVMHHGPSTSSWEIASESMIPTPISSARSWLRRKPSPVSCFNQFYEQTSGAAMGSLISSVIANIFIEHFENETLRKTLKKPEVWFHKEKNIIYKISCKSCVLCNPVSYVDAIIKHRIEFENRYATITENAKNHGTGEPSTSTTKPNIHSAMHYVFGGKLMLCIWWDQCAKPIKETLEALNSAEGECRGKRVNHISKLTDDIKTVAKLLQRRKRDISPFPGFLSSRRSVSRARRSNFLESSSESKLKSTENSRAILFLQELLAGWSMGANVCPKYEGVFRDHPVFPLQFKILESSSRCDKNQRFALEEELLTRYEETKVTADKS
ncbi:hypothetical protein ALC53_12188 [Atta colombica]|uniref:Uncharacterized protein n=1 Tax=Atta colombica TaxID=520822 RepID=A0A195AZD1_9HYME|nr:hypothetical protein ALC53_12188 [Atta colombica]